MLTLIISDGPDDKQASIGSGPTESDPSSATKARTVPGQSQIAVPSRVATVGRMYRPTAAAL
jgi:glycerate-2-kinase